MTLSRRSLFASAVAALVAGTARVVAAPPVVYWTRDATIAHYGRVRYMRVVVTPRLGYKVRWFDERTFLVEPA